MGGGVPLVDSAVSLESMTHNVIHVWLRSFDIASGAVLLQTEEVCFGMAFFTISVLVGRGSRRILYNLTRTFISG